jgi:hypothetical protein
VNRTELLLRRLFHAIIALSKLAARGIL